MSEKNKAAVVEALWEVPGVMGNLRGEAQLELIDKLTALLDERDEEAARKERHAFAVHATIQKKLQCGLDDLLAERDARGQGEPVAWLYECGECGDRGAVVGKRPRICSICAGDHGSDGDISLSPLYSGPTTAPDPLGLSPEHECEEILNLDRHLGDGRSCSLGRITKPPDGFPQERWCLHVKTPLKPEIVYCLNEGDLAIGSALIYAALGYHVDQDWIESIAAGKGTKPPAPDPLGLAAYCVALRATLDTVLTRFHMHPDKDKPNAKGWSITILAAHDLLSTPTPPAAQAVLEVLRRAISWSHSPVRTEHLGDGRVRCHGTRQDQELVAAVVELVDRFPALAAGLGQGGSDA